MSEDAKLAERLTGWAPKLLELIEWLDILDIIATQQGHPELATPEMQNDLRQMSSDATTAAKRLTAVLEAVDIQYQSGPPRLPWHWEPMEKVSYRDGWRDAMQRVKDSTDVAGIEYG